jgi:hypothetical protein
MVGWHDPLENGSGSTCAILAKPTAIRYRIGIDGTGYARNDLLTMPPNRLRYYLRLPLVVR